MRRFLAAAALALLAPLLTGAGQTGPAYHRVELSDADAKALDRISAYLNGLTSLKGDFLQLDPNGGTEQGRFYIAKPGRMRFEYEPPAPTLVVSDGHTVAVANTRLNTVDRYALADTPLKLILADNIDLRHSTALVSVKHDQGGALLVGLRSSTNRAKANITLVFSEPDYELHEWTVVDNQGLSTTTVLRNMQPGAAIDPTLFALPEKKRKST